MKNITDAAETLCTKKIHKNYSKFYNLKVNLYFTRYLKKIRRKILRRIVLENSFKQKRIPSFKFHHHKTFDASPQKLFPHFQFQGLPYTRPRNFSPHLETSPFTQRADPRNSDHQFVISLAADEFPRNHHQVSSLCQRICIILLCISRARALYIQFVTPGCSLKITTQGGVVVAAATAANSFSLNYIA